MSQGQRRKLRPGNLRGFDAASGLSGEVQVEGVHRVVLCVCGDVARGLRETVAQVGGGEGDIERVMLLFGWMRLVPAVRTEFLRGRNLDHVRAARALGVPQWRIMLRHVLPNAMVAVVTFLPFQLNGSIVALTSLDFLGFGLPPGYPSLGELVAQGRANLHAPWIGCSVFGLLGGTLMLLVFIGEGVRDALDPSVTNPAPSPRR